MDSPSLRLGANFREFGLEGGRLRVGCIAGAGALLDEPSRPCRKAVRLTLSSTSCIQKLLDIVNRSLNWCKIKLGRLLSCATMKLDLSRAD